MSLIRDIEMLSCRGSECKPPSFPPPLQTLLIPASLPVRQLPRQLSLIRQRYSVLQLNLGFVPGLTPTMVPEALLEQFFGSVPEEGLALMGLE